jgi:hypothetical protein
MATVLIESRLPLHVVATYTMTSANGDGVSIDVEEVAGEKRIMRVPTLRPKPPRRAISPRSPAPPPRPQDLPRCHSNDQNPHEQEFKANQPSGSASKGKSAPKRPAKKK